MPTRTPASGGLRARRRTRPARACLRRSALLCAMTLAGLASPAPAVDFYWDPNLAAAGIGGSGIWDSIRFNWVTNADGIRFIAPPTTITNGVLWPGGETSAAVFGGDSGGTVSIAGLQTAGQLRFLTDGYTLSGGALKVARSSGFASIDVVEGATATVLSPLEALSQGGAPTLQKTGAGKLVLGSLDTARGRIRVEAGTLQPASTTALAPNTVTLAGPEARLSFAGLRRAELGAIESLFAPVALGSSPLTLTGGAGDLESRFDDGLSGGGSTGIVIGTDNSTLVTIGRLSGRASASRLGYMDVQRGGLSVVNATVELVAPPSATPDGVGALQMGPLASLTVKNEGVLSVTGTANLQGGSRVDVLTNSSLSVLRDTSRSGSFADLLVGSAGGRGVLVLSGPNARVTSEDRIVLGLTAPRDAGTGLVEADTDAFLSAPVLTFASANSRLVLRSGGAASVNRLDDSGPGARYGTVEFDGGTLSVGVTTLVSSLTSADSSFAGALTGNGTLMKLGPGVFSLEGTTNTFSGHVTVMGGTLRVKPGSLVNAMLTVNTGASLDAPGVSILQPLQIGALQGTFDLAQRDTIVELGAANRDGRWHGRFTSGTVGVAKALGTGAQTIVGGTSDAPFTAPFLSVASGALHLSGGHFVLTDVAAKPGDAGPLSVLGTSSLLEIAQGAVVSAGSGVLVSSGGTLRITGEGSRLTLIPTLPVPVPRLVLGPDTRGTLEITERGRAEVGSLVLGARGANTNGQILLTSGGTLDVSTVTVESGAHQIAILGGSARIRTFEYGPTAGSSFIRLTDPDALTPALTVGDPDARPGQVNQLLGTIIDGPNGPGSLRKVGNDTLAAALQLSGRLIVDGGRIQTPGSLTNTTVVLNVDDGLAFNPGVTTVTIGALTGSGRLSAGGRVLLLGSNNRDAEFGGRLEAIERLGKAGRGTQTLTGGGSVGAVVVGGGALQLLRGEFTSAAIDGVSILSAEGSARLSLANGARFDSGARPTTLNDIGGVGAGLELIGTGTRFATGELLLLGGAATTVRVADGAALEIRRGITSNGASSLVVDRGTVVTGAHLSLNEATTLDLSDPDPLSGGTGATNPVAWTVRVAPGLEGYRSDFAYRARIADGPSGPGSVAFVGSDFRASFTGQLDHTGRTIVDGENARVAFGSAPASRELLALRGGAFEFAAVTRQPPWDLTGATLRTDATGSFRYDGIVLLGGTLRGLGHRVDTAGATFRSTSLGVNARMLSTGPVTWVDATLSGELDASGRVTLDNARLTPSATLRLRGDGRFTDVENQGVIDLQGGASLVLDTPTVSGGGSQIRIADGSALSGETLTLRGALLVNNGSLAAPLVVDFGSVAMGAGRFGAMAVNRGGTFSPGNSPGLASTTGPVTLNAGGEYEVELADALGAPGTGFDLWDIDGRLDVNAGLTANSRFVISLISLDGSDAPGLAANFDRRHSFAWTVLRADSITGYDENELRLDTSGFTNDHDGRFGLRLAQVGSRSELQIVYQPVPEPATTALLVGGLATLLVWRRRRDL